MSRRKTAVLVLFLVSVLASPSGAEPVKVKPSPGFAEYLLENTAIGLKLLSPERSHFGGLIPTHHDFPVKSKQELLEKIDTRKYPASYDLRTLGRVSPVGNQGTCGVCWAFSACESLETVNMPKKAQVFSKLHMVLKNDFDVTHGRCQDGGNIDMATAYLARWTGPVLESQMPYHQDLTVTNSGEIVPAGHVLNADYFDFDMDRIKTALMNVGAVYTTMQYHKRFYDADTHSFYNDGSLAALDSSDADYDPHPNHAVLLVGWDDNYPADKFGSGAAPPKNGAFIAQNSWGSDWGDGGFFYISYSDNFIGQNNASFSRVYPPTSFDIVYSYDPLGWMGSWQCTEKTGTWGANVFTVDEPKGENLGGIGFYTAEPDVTVEYFINTALSDQSRPTSGKTVKTARQKFTDSGYHTILLSESIPIPYKMSFSVVIRFYKPSAKSADTEGASLAVESIIAGLTSKATPSGHSFGSCDGVSWEPLTSWDASNTNACIKAYSSRK